MENQFGPNKALMDILSRKIIICQQLVANAEIISNPVKK